MCGIVGYIGNEQAAPFLLDGLKKLEYRGYDSAGIAVYNDSGIDVEKVKGRIKVLSDMLQGGTRVKGSLGIGHTRWATHGKPSDINSHPHMSETGNFAVVHNGIIENHMKLKNHLQELGKSFVSDTDTEVVAHLLDHFYKGDILDAIIKVINMVEGSYALGIICKDDPDTLYAVRKDNPLIIGLGKHENFIASDIPAILEKTRDIYRMQDNEIAEIKRESVTVYNMAKEVIPFEPYHVNWDIGAAEKGGYEHFMLKEIMEQPKAIQDTISPRIKNGKIVLDEMNLTPEELNRFQKIVIVACGSSYHVGVVSKYVIEKLARIPVEVDLASEFRYRDPLVDETSLVIAISQSGETADTLEALREAKRRGAKVISVVNVVGSSIAMESDGVLYTWAGPEISVATTKAYSTQLAMLYMIAIYLAKQRNRIDDAAYDHYVSELQRLPSLVEQALQNKEVVQYVASRHFNAKSIFFIGRNIDYALSLEGSLKLKEISYIHSEAYAAGELKHGTISLIEDGTLVVALATCKKLFDKTMSNAVEVKTRGACILGLTTEGNEKINDVADHVFYVPEAEELFMPSLAVIPLQLFAYYIALMKNCDIDNPRNLAKSVTVE
ncbi:MAG: glutamine--fructose-6-phosphate transaminase (isomerizing) [Oscillospiraceae bacterium]|nr:glutamine--fructose-6-phosphate transaminase (isomerizing) [Oscillospiraceae bacterium]